MLNEWQYYDIWIHNDETFFIGVPYIIALMHSHTGTSSFVLSFGVQIRRRCTCRVVQCCFSVRL